MEINVFVLEINIDKLTIEEHRNENVYIEPAKYMLYHDKKIGTIGLDEEEKFGFTCFGNFSRFFVSIYSTTKKTNELKKIIIKDLDKILDDCFSRYIDYNKRRMKINYIDNKVNY